MRSFLRFALAACLLVLGGVSVQAQDDLPKAQLRVNEDHQAQANKRYYIEVFADVPLKDSVYQALNGASPPQIGVLTSKGQPVASTASFSNMLVVSPDDTNHTRFRIYLPENMAPFTNFAKKKFAVILTNYSDEAGQSQVRAISVGQLLS